MTFRFGKFFFIIDCFNYFLLKVCVGGILGRELGLGNGQIRNDQLKVSDASSPVLQYPRYIYRFYTEELY